ncbi:MAG: membrane protein insertase YidC, partial [Rhizobiaceae bacterium]
MENNRNFFITIALSVLILTLWQVFYMNPKLETEREAARIAAERVEAEKAAQPRNPASPASPGDIQSPPQGSIPGGGGAVAAPTRKAALAAGAR